MNTTKRKTNAFYGNSQIDQIRVEKKEGDWGIDEANEFTKNITTSVFNNVPEDKNVKLQLVYYFRDVNFFVSSSWFGKVQNFVEPSVDNYDFSGDQFTNVDMILINRVVLGEDGGGDSNKNDCLWYALKRSLGDHLKIMPSTIKKHLKLQRNSLINYKLIPQLEDKIKANINVIGDYTLDSTNTYTHVTYVKLQAHHYTYSPNHKIFDMLYSTPTTKDLLVYEHLNKKEFLCFDGMNEKTVEKNNLINYCKENNYNAVKRTKFQYDKSFTIKKIFYDLVKQGDALRQSSKGLIDVRKTGYDLVKTAKNLFYNSCKSIQFENITVAEEEFLRNSKICGMMYVDKHKRTNMKCYDYNQFYPYILTRTNKYQLPTGQPEIVSLETLPKILSFGLYKCYIDIPHNNKFMIKNRHNVYTHYDLKIARDMKYKITLMDGKNACLYKKKRLYPSQMFKSYMDMLLKLKKKENKRMIKPLMNSLWGALTQKNWIHHNLQKPLVIDNLDNTIVKLNVSRTKPMVDFIKNKTFKYPHARMSPFITACGRYLLYSTIKPFHEKVYRIHTDGFYCDSDIVLETGDKMGELKIEIEGDIEFHHLNNKTVY